MRRNKAIKISISENIFSCSMLFRLAVMAIPVFAAVPADALRIVPGSFKIEPAGEIYVTRTITLSCEIEDDLGVGASGFDCDVTMEPDTAANLVYKVMPDLTCTGSGRSKGKWVYRAASPGTFRFYFTAGIFGCRRGLAYNIAQTSSPIEIKPLPVWSGMELSPRVVAPGEEFTIRIEFRNDAPFDVVYASPEIPQEVFGEFSEISRLVGAPIVSPVSAVDFKKRLLFLPAGKMVTIIWRYKALLTGQARFLITGGGMVVNSPVVNSRLMGNLSLRIPEPDVPVAVGNEFRLRGLLNNSGEARLKGASIALTWSPSGAARILGSSFKGQDILTIDEAPMDYLWRLELLEPGALTLNVVASATEVDTGRRVYTSLTRKLQVLAPPELSVSIKMDSATLMVGSRTDFSVIVNNRSRGAALNVVPLLMVNQGEGRFIPLSPAYQGVAPLTTGVFRGGFIPTGVGAVELGAQISASGDRSGPRVTAVSNPVDLLAMPEPSVRVWSMNNRVFSGGEARVRLWVENPLTCPIRIKTVHLALTGVPAGSDATARVKFAPITLAPGAGATLYAVIKLGFSTKTDEITGAAQFTGELLPFRLPFSVSLERRLLAVSSPRSSRIALLGPPNAFNPVKDMFLNAEVVIAKREEVGLVVMTPEGEVVRSLLRLAIRDSGWLALVWDGLDDAGKPVPSGKYVVRLAGTAPAGAKWPMDAKWKDDHRLTLERP